MSIKRLDVVSDDNCRKTFVMHTTTLQQAYDLMEMADKVADKGPESQREALDSYEKCAEFCIAAMETALTGDNSSTNLFIKTMLRGDAEVAKQNIKKWNVKKETSRIVNHWYEIIEYKKQGLSNKDIATELELSPSRISQILGEIRVEAPELLEGIV